MREGGGGGGEYRTWIARDPTRRNPRCDASILIAFRVEIVCFQEIRLMMDRWMDRWMDRGQSDVKLLQFH